MIHPSLAIALLMTAVAFAAMPAQAQPFDDASSGSENACQGEVSVQTDPYNNYGCSDCAGSIIVQVGHTNDIECRGDACNGNIVVQVGVVNDANCGTGEFLARMSTASAGFPCPPQLPEDNFYCHMVRYLLPQEVCLSLDFCLW